MDATTARFLFTLLCAVGLIAILTGSGLEIYRVRKNATVISPRHFRWRMVSACIWVLILVSLSYAVWFEWPTGPEDPQRMEKMQRFGGILLGSMFLMMLASLLFAVDLFLTMKTRRTKELQLRAAQNQAPLRREIEQIIGKKAADGSRASQNGTSPHSTRKKP